ncbi:MAG: MFS transporter [Gemmatimonadota bacterium]
MGGSGTIRDAIPPRQIAREENVSRQPLYRDPNLRIIFAVTLTAVLAVSSLTPAFPQIAREFHVSARSVGLLISVFTVPGVVLTPLLGILADRWGRKRVLVPSLVLFGLSGAACAAARDFQLLLALRFLQGIGAASLGSLNVTLIGDLFEGPRRTAAMGYNSSVLSVGTATYPALGGLLASVAWYAPFFLPLAALPVALLVILRLENPEPEGRESLRGYLVGVWRGLRDRQAAALFAANAATFVVIFGPYLSFYPLLLDSSFATSAPAIGLAMSAVSLSSAVAAARLGWLTRRIPERRIILFGYIVYALCFVAIPRVGSLGATLPALVAFGLANGFAIPSIFALLAELAPRRHRGAFMSVNGMVLRMGQTLGPLLGGVALAAWGLDAVFYGASALSVIMAVYTALAIR